MSDDLIVRKGERIPRRALPDYSEASSFREALKRDGLIGTLFRDSNQYGPLSMLLVLLISASVTGAIIKMFSLIL